MLRAILTLAILQAICYGIVVIVCGHPLRDFVVMSISILAPTAADVLIFDRSNICGILAKRAGYAFRRFYRDALHSATVTLAPLRHFVGHSWSVLKKLPRTMRPAATIAFDHLKAEARTIHEQVKRWFEKLDGSL